MPSSNILVVEDDAIIVMDLRSRLQRLGHTVASVVASAEAAIATVPRVRPDLVLMDIKLEGSTDGIEAAQAIHHQFDIPVVFLTAYADEQMVKRAVEAEAFGYLVKPVQDRELFSAIEVAISKWAYEQKLKSLNDQLHQRVREITALNRIFQTHLHQRFEVAHSYTELVTSYTELFTGVRKLLHDTSLLVASGHSKPIAGLNNPSRGDLNRE